MTHSELAAAAPLPPGLAERGFRFCHAIRVRYRDIDGQAIVFNPNYMVYVDYGITEYFRHLGFPWKELEKHHFDVAVVKAVLEFRTPAAFDDIVYIGMRTVRVGNSSFVVQVCMWRTDGTDPGSVALEGEMTYVNYDPQARKSRPIPPIIRKAIHLLEGEVEGL